MNTNPRVHAEAVDVHEWKPPPASLALSHRIVHIWRVSLDHIAADVQHLEESLSEEERRRSARFRFERDRQNYIVARGALRAILARYLGVEPRGLQLDSGLEGKPFLANKFGASGIRFNLAHSGMWALYAIAHNREVGIDLECIMPALHATHIATRFFSASENAALMALPEDQRQQAFFTCWTRKEAYLKALGQGLSLSLDEFDVTVAPGDPAMLLADRRRLQNVGQWFMYDLAVGVGYAAALVVEGGICRLQCWDWIG